MLTLCMFVLSGSIGIYLSLAVVGILTYTLLLYSSHLTVKYKQKYKQIQVCSSFIVVLYEITSISNNINSLSHSLSSDLLVSIGSLKHIAQNDITFPKGRFPTIISHFRKEDSRFSVPLEVNPLGCFRAAVSESIRVLREEVLGTIRSCWSDVGSLCICHYCAQKFVSSGVLSQSGHSLPC